MSQSQSEKTRRKIERRNAEELAEHERRVAFDRAGLLDQRAYSVSPGIEAFDTGWLARVYRDNSEALARLKDPTPNQTGYSPNNGYFDSPDADILYMMVRHFKPRRVLEIGCGNSTRITRQAVIDGDLDTRITAVDPQPRADISGLYDHFEQAYAETLPDELFSDLTSGDVLFIDSSHQIRIGNDVAHLFCRIIPRLAPGVIIHVHDVFLPYEYPARFFYDCPSWGEQYILHALLEGGGYEVLWPGYFLQQERPETVADLPFMADGRAQSFWIRKR